jgi:hypothetical protein
MTARSVGVVTKPVSRRARSAAPSAGSGRALRLFRRIHKVRGALGKKTLTHPPAAPPLRPLARRRLTVNPGDAGLNYAQKTLDTKNSDVSPRGEGNGDGARGRSQKTTASPREEEGGHAPPGEGFLASLGPFEGPAS